MHDICLFSKVFNNKCGKKIHSQPLREGPWRQRCVSACAHVGMWGCGAYGYAGIRACGHVGMWAFGHVDIWACGNVGMSAFGHVGMWVRSFWHLGMCACGHVGMIAVLMFLGEL